MLSFVFEQNSYARYQKYILTTPNPSSLGINIEEILSNYILDAIPGMIFLYLYAKSQRENYFKDHFTSIILVSTN